MNVPTALDLSTFRLWRKRAFYPKTDLPASDNLSCTHSRSALPDSTIKDVCRQSLTKEITGVESLGCGTYHRVWRVVGTSGPPLIFRQNAFSERFRDYPLLIDGAVEQQLRRAEVPAVHVHACDLSRQCHPFDYAILDEAAGCSLKDFDHDDGAMLPLLSQLGRVLARLHRIKVDSGFGLLDVAPLLSDSKALVGAHSAWDEYILLNLEEHVLRCVEIGAISNDEAEQIQKLFEKGRVHLACQAASLLHGDPGNHNIFVDHGSITALIDWEDALAGDPIYEIAFWATFHPERRHAALLDGYREEGALPSDFEPRFWLYYLRVSLAKTIVRHRLGLMDVPGREPASGRIRKSLMQLSAVLNGNLKWERSRISMAFDPHRTESLARTIRADSLRMVHRANASHIGSCLSMADLLAVLYGSVLRIDPAQPEAPDRDRFVLSKGHAAAAVYSCLSACGFFPENWLDTYCADGTRLSGHLTHHGVPGVEVSTGSLGHGLPIGCGMALAAKRLKRPYRVFVLLSDGECDEGSNWEAALFAPQHQLDNLIVIVDYNKIQSFGRVDSVLDLEPFAAKWQSFGWAVHEIDGHDHRQIHAALASLPVQPRLPTVLLAHTVKGKGVPFMEDRLEWHYRSPSAEQLADALALMECGR